MYRAQFPYRLAAVLAVVGAAQCMAIAAMSVVLAFGPIFVTDSTVLIATSEFWSAALAIPWVAGSFVLLVSAVVLWRHPRGQAASRGWRLGCAAGALVASAGAALAITTVVTNSELPRGDAVAFAMGALAAVYVSTVALTVAFRARRAAFSTPF